MNCGLGRRVPKCGLTATGSFADSRLWSFVDPKTAFPQPAHI